MPAAIGKGRIARIDTSAAERVAGVLLVLTHRNMDRLKPVGFSFAGGQAQQSFQPLQSDLVAYRGQPKKKRNPNSPKSKGRRNLKETLSRLENE